MTFGERLKQLRAERELHQEDVGAVVGFGKSTVSQWEAGERIPAHPVLEKLADYFQVSLDYLVGRSEGRSGEPLPTWVSQLPPDMQEFVREESKNGWPYLRLARGMKMQDLSPAELQAIIETWMDAKRRYEQEFGKGK